MEVSVCSLCSRIFIALAVRVKVYRYVKIALVSTGSASEPDSCRRRTVLHHYCQKQIYCGREAEEEEEVGCLSHRPSCTLK